MIGLARPRIGWIYAVHLWVGLIVAIQLLLWTASGLVMTANPIETVRGEHLRRKPAPIDLRSAGRVLPPEAVLTSPVEAAELAMLLGRPVYRLKSGERRWR